MNGMMEWNDWMEWGIKTHKPSVVNYFQGLEVNTVHNNPESRISIDGKKKYMYTGVNWSHKIELQRKVKKKIWNFTKKC